MSRPHACSRPRRGALATLSVAVVLVAALNGCSAADDSPGAEQRSRSAPSLPTGTELKLETTVTRVHGELSATERRRLESAAGAVLSGYLSAAYLHQRTTAGHRGSFPGFTRGARRLASHDVSTASDAAFAWAEEVRPLEAVAFLSVVAPEGRPAGATARLLFRIHASDERRNRVVTVRGRLLLTPAAEQWQIFGYDLSVGSKPTGRGA